ncbi:MAG: hypothetical protein JXR63_10730 [Spirochaetales bacterium]|nr:hypothetical protein [Spirochaetales bacterium]
MKKFTITLSLLLLSLCFTTANELEIQLEQLRHEIFTNSVQEDPTQLLLNLFSSPEGSTNLPRLGTVACEYMLAYGQSPELLDATNQAYAAVIKSINNPSTPAQLNASADFAFTMGQLFPKKEKNHFNQAKSFLRRSLQIESKNQETQLRMGIFNAMLIAARTNNEVNNIRTTALKQLSEESIESCDDKFLQFKAMIWRSALFFKTLDTRKAFTDLNMALEIFPNQKMVNQYNLEYMQNALEETDFNYLGFGMDVMCPYYNDFGLEYRKNDTVILAPYIGIALQKTFFSSSIFAESGIKVFHKDFSWSLEYLHAFIPSFSTFDYALHEFYGKNTFRYDLPHFTITSTTKFGNFLFAQNQDQIIDKRESSLRDFAIKQEFQFDFAIFDNGIYEVTSTINSGLVHIPNYDQTSFYLEAKMPCTFDFAHSEFGIMPSLFYSEFLSEKSEISIGKKFLGYDGAVNLNKKTITDSALFYNFYQLAGSIDLVYRVYLQPLKAPADRIYIGFDFNTGFATNLQTMETDPFYSGGVAIGFNLNDATPFELRFGVDQDANFYIYLSKISKLRHKY